MISQAATATIRRDPEGVVAVVHALAALAFVAIVASTPAYWI